MLQWLLVDVQQPWQRVQRWQANTKANTNTFSISISFTFSNWRLRNQRPHEEVRLLLRGLQDWNQ
jgi:hypothetical protein